MQQNKMARMVETMELKLNSPITKEQLELITDANLEHSDTIWFNTPNGNCFEYKKVQHGKWVQRKVLEPLAWDASPLDPREYAPATHSEWVKRTFCSKCDYEPLAGKTKFCPNCGVKMEE